MFEDLRDKLEKVMRLMHDTDADTPKVMVRELTPDELEDHKVMKIELDRIEELTGRLTARREIFWNKMKLSLNDFDCRLCIEDGKVWKRE
jgi:hypothetical protein